MLLDYEDNKMLTKLLPDQISKFWDIIKYAIEESLPPLAGDHPDRMNRILSALLSSKVQCWASYRREKNNTIFEGVCLTKLLYDDVSDTRNLLLYSVYGYEKTIEETWMEAFLAVAKYAEGLDCNRIVGYTSVPYLVEKAKLYGANTDNVFVSFDISKTSKKIVNKEI